MLLTVSLLCIVTFIAGLIDSIAGRRRTAQAAPPS